MHCICSPPKCFFIACLKLTLVLPNTFQWLFHTYFYHSGSSILNIENTWNSDTGKLMIFTSPNLDNLSCNLGTTYHWANNGCPTLYISSSNFLTRHDSFVIQRVSGYHLTVSNKKRYRWSLGLGSKQYSTTLQYSTTMSTAVNKTILRYRPAC